MIFYSLTINLSNMRSALKRWTWLLNLTPSIMFCKNKHRRRHLHICDRPTVSDSYVRYVRKKSYFKNRVVTKRQFDIIFCLCLKFKTSFIRILKLLQILSVRVARHHSPVQSHSWSLKAGRRSAMALWRIRSERFYSDFTLILRE